MSSKQLYAHTPAENSDKWQTLDEHLSEVARLAGEFAGLFNAADLGRYLGHLHDLGKASDSFQSYLQRCHAAQQRGEKPSFAKVDHKQAGASFASKQGGAPGLLAIPILGHHGGMPSCGEIETVLSQFKESDLGYHTLSSLQQQFFPDLKQPIIPPQFTSNALSYEMFLRMLYSCLVDADFLDTESFWNPEKHRVRNLEYDSIDTLWSRFLENRAEKLKTAADTLVNRIRNEIYQACLKSAEEPQGVFRLTVPTGGGKTLSGMAFALKHAQKHELKRVIVAIPYTSIIDQNAKVYRELFGERNVLEHHSAITPPSSDEYSEQALKQELAAENWDAPVVVTTTVQLFESLFSNKPSKCRKLHRYAKSVIILDEVQTLPVGMVQPILDGLKELVTNYQVTLVLSTATQPAFSGSSPYLQGFPECREIVPDSARYFESLKRVDYHIKPTPWSWGQVASEMMNRKQVLCILNSRKDAVELLNLLDDKEALHLSTLLCPAHRREVLEKIHNRLKSGEPCRVVSTQVVEAGVDLDFPCVMRASGPLDRIVQAAGRCNREGRMDGMGEVILFQPEEGRAPRGAYATAMADSKRFLLQEDINLHDPNVFDRYFNMLWQDCKLDVNSITNLRRRLEFKEVALQFKLIEDISMPVLVSYQEDQLDTLITQIKHSQYITRDSWKHLQIYTVNLNKREFERFRGEGLIVEIIPNSKLYQWYGNYDKIKGVDCSIPDIVDLLIP